MKTSDYQKDANEAKKKLESVSPSMCNNIKLSANDNIIFSSKEIPGNEKPISFLKNSFSYLGLNIISDEDEFVHVSEKKLVAGRICGQDQADLRHSKKY